MLDGIGKIFILAGILAFVLDLVDRQSSRAATAWELVTNKTEGNSGKVPALEYLNQHYCPSEILWGCKIWPFKKRQSLAHLNLSSGAHGSPVYLAGVNLEDAWLSDVNLTEANLRGANLSNTMLQLSWLCGVDLAGANLSNADLSGAKLVGAILDNTNLSNADIAGADLRKATVISEQNDGSDKMNDCAYLKKAKNWQLSIRSENLACGSNIRAEESLSDVIESCRFYDIPDHIK